MDKDTWKAFLGFLEKASLAIQHPALRFLAVFAGIVSAFLLLLGAITAGTQDTQLNQFLFVGAFVVLVIRVVPFDNLLIFRIFLSSICQLRGQRTGLLRKLIDS